MICGLEFRGSRVVTAVDRRLVGHCGWGPGQLEAELAEAFA